MYGMPSIVVFWKINIIKQCWRMMNESRMENNLLWQLFISDYNRNCKIIYAQVLKDINKNKFQSKGFIYDVCYILIGFKMDKYFKIKTMEMSKEELKDMLNNMIIRKFFVYDINYIKIKNIHY